MKVKEWKKIYPANTNHKKAHISCTNFRQSMTRKRECFIAIRESTDEENLTNSNAIWENWWN